MIQRLPLYIDWLQTSVLPWLHHNFGFDPKAFEMNLLHDRLADYAQEIGSVALNLLESLRASSTVVFTWLAHLVLIPLVTFYLLRDWDELVAGIQELLPRRIVFPVSVLARESDVVIGAFLRGQLIVMAALGVFYSVGLAFIGLQFPLLIGMLAGLVSFVPYMGLIIGVLVASIAAVLEFHSILSIIPVVIVFSLGQGFSDFFLTPKLIGDRIGLHPVAVLFAVLAGGQLFGFFGILLALPVAAVIMVLLRRARSEYLGSSFYRG